MTNTTVTDGHAMGLYWAYYEAMDGKDEYGHPLPYWVQIASQQKHQDVLKAWRAVAEKSLE